MMTFVLDFVVLVVAAENLDLRCNMVGFSASPIDFFVGIVVEGTLEGTVVDHTCLDLDVV